MFIGIDLDNTIVSYDDIFRREAVERKLLPAELATDKEAIRDYLCGREEFDQWAQLQGHIYGPGISGAKPFPGVLEFFRRSKAAGIRTCIISHKTEIPYSGASYDLRQSAVNWLGENGFLETASTGLQRDHITFASSRPEKITLITQSGCTHFIDDLPKILSDESFPKAVNGILFDPLQIHAGETRFQRITTWDEAASVFLKEAANA